MTKNAIKTTNLTLTVSITVLLGFACIAAAAFSFPFYKKFMVYNHGPLVELVCHLPLPLSLSLPLCRD